jgi:glyoxylase-like metal-dependent hydrolase (beta-lactamase superfamily II)
MVDVGEVAENIYLIDDMVCSIPKMGSVYFLDEEKKVLVDSGPPSSASVVLEGIRKIGARPEDINYIIVTHVHIDHAGGAGVLLRDMPQAQVVVHHRGARHLLKLTELMQSSIKTVGNEIVTKWGEGIPLDPERVLVIHDNDVIQLSEKQTLDFIDAPGHAPHELCVYERRNNGIFTGEALGLYFAKEEVLLPCHPPPSFDLESCGRTIQRLMKLNSSLLYFAHFGVTNRVEEILGMALDRLQIYNDIMAEAIKEDNLHDVQERILAQVAPKLELMRKAPSAYQLVVENLIPWGIAGFVDYYNKQQEKLMENGN